MSGDICVHPSEQRRAAQAGCVWLLRGCGRGRKHQARDEGLCQQKAQQRQGFIDSHKERPVLEEEVPLLAIRPSPWPSPGSPAPGAVSSLGPTPVLVLGSVTRAWPASAELPATPLE